MIKSSMLKKLNRSSHSFDIIKESVPIDTTDLLLYNEEGECTSKIIKEMPPLMVNMDGQIFRLNRVGKIKSYIHRDGTKLVCGYSGRFGTGFMLAFPSWEGAVISLLGYYIEERRVKKND